jgi:hypothetical protein
MRICGKLPSRTRRRIVISETPNSFATSFSLSSWSAWLSTVPGGNCALRFTGIHRQHRGKPYEQIPQPPRIHLKEVDLEECQFYQLNSAFLPSSFAGGCGESGYTGGSEINLWVAAETNEADPKFPGKFSRQLSKAPIQMTGG